MFMFFQHTYQPIVFPVASILMGMLLCLALQLPHFPGPAFFCMLMPFQRTGEHLVPVPAAVVMLVFFQLAGRLSVFIVTGFLMDMLLQLAGHLPSLRGIASFGVLMDLALLLTDKDFLLRPAFFCMGMRFRLLQPAGQYSVCGSIAVIIMDMYCVICLPAYQLISLVTPIRMLVGCKPADQFLLFM